MDSKTREALVEIAKQEQDNCYGTMNPLADAMKIHNALRKCGDIARALLTAEPEPSSQSRAELCVKFCEGFDNEVLIKGPSLSELASAYPDEPEPCEDAQLDELKKDYDYLLSKVNWGASFLDGKAIEIMNTLWGRIVNATQVADKRSEELIKQEYPIDGVSDDLLWQEIFSLREQLKIAGTILKSYNPDTDVNEFLAGLGHMDFLEYLDYYYNSDESNKRAEDLRAQVEILKGLIVEAWGVLTDKDLVSYDPWEGYVDDLIARLDIAGRPDEALAATEPKQ